MAGKPMVPVVVLAVALVLTMVMNGIAAKNYTVGDDNEWSIPSSPDFYSSWAANHTFVVGDTLVFIFTAGHTVAVVMSEEAYEKCDTSLDENAVIVTQGPLEVNLTSTEPQYYFCTVPGHCDAGLKLAINVIADS